MPSFAWDDRSRQLMDQADQQCQHLVGLLDKAYAETVSGEAIENLGVLIDGLADYATVHFYFVEHMMSISSDLVEHREEHKVFMSGVGELQIAYYCASRSVPLDTLSFLINWLTHHKLRRDIHRLKDHLKPYPSPGTPAQTR